MDSIPDLSPVNAQPQPFSAIPTNGAHPPYPDMIVEAIVALKDRDGSSRQAIAKFIERHHPNLPPTHSSLLTHHLKRMKNEGQLTMVKHSYMLTPPRSVPFEAPTPAPAPAPAATMDHNIADYSITSTDTYGTSPGFKAENSSVQPRRKPGRPPKPRHEFGFQVQNHQPENQPAAEIPPYQPQFENQLGTGQDFHLQNTSGQDLQPPYGSVQEFQGNYAVTAAEPIFASLGLADDGATVAPPLASPETAVVSAKRGRGRPPKNASATKPVVTSSGDAGGDAGGAGGGDAGGVAGGDTGGGAAGGGNGDASGGGEVGGERRVRRKVGRPKLKSIMLFNGGGMKRGVGRPKRIGRPVTVPLSGNVMRSRGRPRKLVPRPAQIVSVNGGDGEGVGVGVGVGEVGSVSRGRGRPRKGSDTARKSISQSFGWPTQFGAGTSVIVTDPTQLVAYQELKSKYDHLQSKAREVLEVARPYMNSDYEASGVLQELETLLGTTNAAA